MNNLEKKQRIMNNRDPIIQLPPPILTQITQSKTKPKMNMQKSCFGNRQFIQILFFLTYNKPLDKSNQGFILRHSTVHIKQEHLRYKQLKQKTYNQKLPMEPGYGVGRRETSYSNVTSLCTEVPLPSEKKGGNRLYTG